MIGVRNQEQLVVSSVSTLKWIVSWLGLFLAVVLGGHAFAYACGRWCWW